MAARTVVKQTPEKEIPTEVIADAIVSIAEGIHKIRAGRLNDRALVLLIQHAALGVTGRDVKAVLAGIENLEREYLKPAK